MQRLISTWPCTAVTEMVLFCCTALSFHTSHVWIVLPPGGAECDCVCFGIYFTMHQVTLSVYGKLAGIMASTADSQQTRCWHGGSQVRILMVII